VPRSIRLWLWRQVARAISALESSTGPAGLRLQLSDFACEELIENVVRDGDREILLSTQQLCQYLAAAEDKVRKQELLGKISLPLRPKSAKYRELPQRG
jgi:hypothetical protein